MVINENVKKKIIPVASGKGGVGKTIIAANLALALAAEGKKSTIVDLDLGGSNLHTCLGLKNISPGVGNFLSGKGLAFKDIVQKTPYPHLQLIPGDVLVAGLTNLSLSQKKRIMLHIVKLDSDYVIIDLGSGAHSTVIDFFLISNSGFVVTTPQATSIVNTYNFLKNLMFRFFQRALSPYPNASEYLRDLLREQSPNSTPTISQIVAAIESKNSEAGQKAKRYLSALHPKLIINLADSPDNVYISGQLRDLIKRNLEIEVECMGLIYNDKTVKTSVSESVPLLKYDSECLASRSIVRIAKKILQSERFPVMSLEGEQYKDSFELTMIEAQNDYEESVVKAQDKEKPDIGELISLISNQKQQINELRGTVRMLTMKTQ
ncbi:MAG: P-loop NTPase [Spirochaetota bacterium]|nr:MAG: P-loop NTPase [Spirochaetota bacterium]